MEILAQTSHHDRFRDTVLTGLEFRLSQCSPLFRVQRISWQSSGHKLGGQRLYQTNGFKQLEMPYDIRERGI